MTAFDLFPALAELPGVAYTSPPPHLIADAIAHVTAQLGQVPTGAHGAIVAVGNRQAEDRSRPRSFSELYVVMPVEGRGGLDWPCTRTCANHGHENAGRPDNREDQA